MNHLLIPVSALFLILIGAFAACRRWKRMEGGDPRVLLTGGGTGGHVNPALAIAEGIKSREPETRFLYVGVKNKAESVIVNKAGYELRFVCSEGYPGISPSFRTFRFLLKLSFGIAQSIIILISFAPKWIIATGGYVSAPVIIAAVLLKKLKIARVRIFLHEQNSIPGQLNALMGKWADRVLLTFPQTLSFFPNATVVGYPIRHSIVPISPQLARQRLTFQIPQGRDVVFAFGGSQGARTINRAMVDALPFLLPHRHRLFMIHGSGLSTSSEYDAAADTEKRIEKTLSPEQRALLGEFYYRQDYFHNIAEIYSVSSLIVCRSGAGSLNEISRIGKPVLLIPKVNLPGDHQVMNARAMKSAGAAEVLFEDTVMENGGLLEKLDGKVLAEKILALIENPARLRQMGERSTNFLRRKAIERIMSELYADMRFTDGNGHQGTPFIDLAGNAQLLQMLSSAYSRSGRNFDPAVVAGGPDDLAYYRHRAAGLLSHKAWQDRNLGVKLIGFTRYREKIPTLLEMLSDRTPVSRVRRFFGGDFVQVGFIRRNIVHALEVLDHFDPDVEKHLLEALEDPYFEVRAQACRCAAHFGPFLAGKRAWMNRILECLEDDCFEVVMEAAKALGETGTDWKAAEALLSMNESHYWQVRNAALYGLKRMIERGVLKPSAELLSMTSSFILTSTDFRPHFQVKETFAALRERSKENDKSEGRSLGAPASSDRVARKIQ
ncbi:MAG: glycosyltransferase [Syntrophobacteraceae bacterium]|jgi:UDP-N-acetylglucosamine--N-acetylmuramyl-(pentapeptide) pyrophosphoryl-undecaprenol N-acetylglucosamine transferase